MGAEVSFETRNQQGKCPDFRARFTDGEIVVEAVSPVYNPEVGHKSTSRITLLNLIEGSVPNGWQVAVRELPEIGPSDSKREFKTAIQRLLDLPPPADSDTDVESVLELSTGSIRLHLYPSVSGGDRIIVEPALSAWGDSEKRIKNAVHRKRKQVRGSDMPVLLAVQNSSIMASFEDYDIALFGRGFETYDQSDQLIETGFRPTGALNEKREKLPTYAGVLAFLEMGFMGGQPPVLYQHPRFSGILPRAVLELQVRTYDREAGFVRVKESQNESLMQGLKVVRV
jgi:hypothetical protein